MSNEQIEHSLDDIMRDSIDWADSATVLGNEADVAESLPVYESQFSFLAVKANIHSIYEEIRQELARLLREGQAAQDDIAEKLFIAAKHYEDNEQEARERIVEIALERGPVKDVEHEQ